MMATRTVGPHDEPDSQCATDPALAAPPVAWSDEPGEPTPAPTTPAPTTPTPTDDKIKLGIAAVSFIAMTVSLIAGHELVAAAFGGIVTSIVDHYFRRKS